MMHCSLLAELRFQTEGIWHIVDDPPGAVLLKEISENSLPEPEHAPIYYEPKRRSLAKALL